jgi:hypothetical protein
MTLDCRARDAGPLPKDPDERRALIARNRATPEPDEQVAAFLASDRVLTGADAGPCWSRAADVWRAFEQYADDRAWSPHLRPTVAAFGRQLGARFERRRDGRGVRYARLQVVPEL